jgi:hypothetical protein
MPWKSDAQRRWGNSQAGIKAMGKSAVEEFNQASKGEKMGHIKQTHKPGIKSLPLAGINAGLEEKMGFTHKPGNQDFMPYGINTSEIGSKTDHGHKIVVVGKKKVSMGDHHRLMK